MRRIALFVLVALVGIAVAAPNRAIDRLGTRLHEQVGKKRGNLIYSPLSIALALSMTREGATDATAKEMDNVLGTGTPADAKAVIKALTAKPAPKTLAPQLAIANRLYGDAKLTFEKAFLDITRTDYGAPIEAADFRNAPDVARAAINKWVAEQTKDRIKDLLGAGTIDKLTRLVLVNAIYLKAQWQTPFVKAATQPAPFTVEGGAVKQPPTMRGQVRTLHGTLAGGRSLILPYAGTPSLSMLIVVPDKAKLVDLEAAYLKSGDLSVFLNATTKSAKVNVAMPKFTFASDFDLGAALGAMGMKRAFGNDAEFAAITKQERLKISKVIHKAFIKVDEDGTEAAAATAVAMARVTSVDPTPVIDFKVDRSFLFYIYDDKGTVLFGGRVVDP